MSILAPELPELGPFTIGARRDAVDGEDAVPYLRFSGEAQEAFSSWRGELEHRLRDEELPPHLVAHLSKYRGLMPRLALICHLASGGTGPVSLAALLQVQDWITYLESHARRVYASTEVDNSEAARALWRRAKKGDLPTPFTARDVQRKGWSMLKAKERIEGGLALSQTPIGYSRRLLKPAADRPAITGPTPRRCTCDVAQGTDKTVKRAFRRFCQCPIASIFTKRLEAQRFELLPSWRGLRHNESAEGGSEGTVRSLVSAPSGGEYDISARVGR